MKMMTSGNNDVVYDNDVVGNGSDGAAAAPDLSGNDDVYDNDVVGNGSDDEDDEESDGIGDTVPNDDVVSFPDSGSQRGEQ